MGEFETSGLPLSSLAMARASVCWGKPQCSHIGRVSPRLSQTHLTQSMELLFWGWNASVSYPHSGFSYHPSMILVPSSEWKIPPSAIKERKKWEEVSPVLPWHPVSFHPSHVSRINTTGLGTCLQGTQCTYLPLPRPSHSAPMIYLFFKSLCHGPTKIKMLENLTLLGCNLHL